MENPVGPWKMSVCIFHFFAKTSALLIDGYYIKTQQKHGGPFNLSKKHLGSLLLHQDYRAGNHQFYGFKVVKRKKTAKTLIWPATNCPGKWRSSLGTSANRRASPHTKVTSNGKHVTTWRTARHWKCICTRQAHEVEVIWTMLSDRPDTKGGFKLKMHTWRIRHMQSLHIIYLSKHFDHTICTSIWWPPKLTTLISSKRTSLSCDPAGLWNLVFIRFMTW